MFCILCRGEIDGARARRGAVTCSDRCSREVSRQRRQASAEKKCRLCGRKFRNRKPVDGVAEDTALATKGPEQSFLGPVRDAHSGISETVRIEEPGRP
jgi:hypothetical protein